MNKSGAARERGDLVQFKLRFREDLRSKLEQAAQESGNSINSEIVARLTRSVTDDDLLGTGPTRRLMIEIAAQIAHVENIVGRTWDEDPAVYFAARQLAEDVWRRSKPRQSDTEAIAELEAELLEASDRRRRLIASLKTRGAVELCDDQPSGSTRSDHLSYRATPSSNWRDPSDPDQAMSDLDWALIEVELKDLERLDRRAAQLRIELEAKQGAWRLAAERGHALYQGLIGALETAE